ncbi:MAG TPA: biopolymer transporter ExbD [Spirochaetota bacterium]|jgi:biopolymer transport protein ExbD|nr:MAG: biopolymer transport protein ExbD [Spirochaetes bacterium ADurb.Bin133]HNZ26945.1 biopolymer transporter ExbD [Spirochaetota bacterium]HOF00686.1 biopolymer transporter ExbD [Spirochaetota bacterium]HOS33056.1 biopolymer transporter ExbD [Spirochaetota bacterium]HOS55908.1 biopolymer transporter ExbD [Spirochaetota bacterium]
MSIKFARRNKPKALVDMVPMIDIVFQLIIFFMVATTVKTITGMELDMPKAENLTNISSVPLKIVVLSRNNITIGDKKTDIAGFRNILQTELKTNYSLKKSVIIYGDKSIEYQLLIDVMDVLRVEGYESIDLAINKKF